MNFETLFVNPNGRSSRAQYIPAMITVLAVTAFYAFVVTGRTAQFCMLVLLYPTFVLLARRLQDMGQSAWLVLAPLVLMLATDTVQLGYFNMGAAIDNPLAWVAYAVTAAFLLWGCLGQGRRQAP